MSNWAHPDDLPSVPDWFPQPDTADDTIPGNGEAINNSMSETKIKSLGDAREIISELEAKIGYKRPLNQEPIRTLNAAKGYISFLQAKLGKPSVKVPAEIKNLVASKLSSSSLPTLEAIAAELANATFQLRQNKAVGCPLRGLLGLSITRWEKPHRPRCKCELMP
jgi:hypothetical protein